MSRALFQPIGDRPRWEIVGDLIKETPTDGIIRYDDAANRLGLSPSSHRSTVQAAIREAGRHHMEETGRCLEAVKNVGYRVVKAGENFRLARKHQQRSKRQLRRASKTLKHTDRSLLTPEEAERFDSSERAIGALIDFTRRLDIRQTNLENALAHVSNKTDRNSEEVAELKNRLARLEGKT